MLEISFFIRLKDSKQKKICLLSLDGINGWSFNPIAVATNGIEDYYFTCKVKTITKNLQMEMVKVYVRIQEGNTPRLLAIEEIS